MILQKPVFLVFLILLLGSTGFVFSQIDTLPPQIINPDTVPMPYCSDSVLVAPVITIKNVSINEEKEGMKISIVNYKQDEDILVAAKDPKFIYYWNNYYGYLEIKGVGSDDEYQEAIRNVYYKNIANVPNRDDRSFTISLLDADYLPSTNHFYRFVKKTDITWKEARDSAANLEYYGLQGYLATVTSAAENDFIWTKIDGVGWIGASDEESEGVWKWVTGPEAGTQFWQGAENGSRVNNEFSFWSSGEPNNLGDEDYAHINQNPSKAPKSWNDLQNTAGGPNSQYYRAQGFIVEFGGMTGDPVVSLSASSVIRVRKIAFSDEKDFEICLGESKRLNVEASDVYSYSWSPDENIESTTRSNPLVKPDKTIRYKVVGNLEYCTDSAFFDVLVNPLPQHSWEKENIICENASIELNPGVHESYLWNNLDTMPTQVVSAEGWYTVKITNEFGCTSKDSANVKWSILPKLDFSEVDTLVCGSNQQKLNLAFEEGSASTHLFSLDANATITDPQTLSPTITVEDFGKYDFRMEVTDQYNCEFLDTLNIEFHNQPEAKVVLDEEKCQGYNLDLRFDGTTVEPTFFSWYSNDTVFAEGEEMQEIIIPLGFGQRNRTVGLKVNEQGCKDSVTLDVKVYPKLDFWIEENEDGCTPLITKFGNRNFEDIKTYTWHFGDGDSTNVENPVHTYQNSGVEDRFFDVRLSVVSLEGCTNTGVQTKAVLVHPIPTVDLDFDENICYSEKETVWYKGSGNENDTYNWDLSAFQPDEILQNPGNLSGPFEFKRSSEPTATIGIQVVSEFGCETDSMAKIFSRKPIFEVELDKKEGCVPLNVLFTATTLDLVDAIQYKWDFGDGSSLTGNSVENLFIEDDKKFDINLFVSSSLTGCSDTLLISEGVFVYPQPKARFIPDPVFVLISNPLIQFENKSENATFYEWDFDDNSAISDEVNPLHRFTKMGFYDVLLSAFNDFACTDTTIEQVAVVFDQLFPPNAFSPNAILKEDCEFRIYAEGVVEEGYQLQIFNRWGEVFFESQSQNTAWDGKMKNGNFAPAGVYTWIIQYRDFTGKDHKQQGTVTLLF